MHTKSSFFSYLNMWFLGFIRLFSHPWEWEPPHTILAYSRPVLFCRKCPKVAFPVVSCSLWPKMQNKPKRNFQLRGSQKGGGVRPLGKIPKKYHFFPESSPNDHLLKLSGWDLDFNDGVLPFHRQTNGEKPMKPTVAWPRNHRNNHWT